METRLKDRENMKGTKGMKGITRQRQMKRKRVAVNNSVQKAGLNGEL